MDEEKFENQERKHRRGIFFPLLLLSAGILLLLSNFGMLPGGFWGFISLYWPILLILAGLDGLLKGDGIAGSLLTAGFGAVILAGNLGYFSISPWELLLKAWPLLLIGLGLDIIIGRRTFARVVVGLVVTAGLLYGLVMLSGINGRSGLSEQEFKQPYQSESNFNLNLERINGIVRASGYTNSTTLIAGTFAGRKNATFSPDIKQTDSGTSVSITDFSSGYLWPMDSFASSNWIIKINPKPLLSLHSRVILGENDLDVRGLHVERLDVETSMGRSLITLGTGQNVEVNAKGAIGDIIIFVPKGAPVRLQMNKAISVSKVPDSYSQNGSEFTSKNFNSPESSIQITVDLPIGSIQLIEYTP